MRSDVLNAEQQARLEAFAQVQWRLRHFDRTRGATFPADVSDIITAADWILSGMITMLDEAMPAGKQPGLCACGRDDAHATSPACFSGEPPCTCGCPHTRDCPRASVVGSWSS